MLLCYKSDRAITYVFCRDLHLIFMFSGLLQKRSVSRKVKFGEKLFQTKLLSHLSNKVCRLLSSPVLLRKFTKYFQRNAAARRCVSATQSQRGRY